jgi:hypothetical protein
MHRTLYKVLPADNGQWCVENAELGHVSGILPNKEQALVRAEALALAVEPALVRIFREDGTVEDERWYDKRLRHGAARNDIA